MLAAVSGGYVLIKLGKLHTPSSPALTHDNSHWCEKSLLYYSIHYPFLAGCLVAVPLIDVFQKPNDGSDAYDTQGQRKEF